MMRKFGKSPKNTSPAWRKAKSCCKLLGQPLIRSYTFTTACLLVALIRYEANILLDTSGWDECQEMSAGMSGLSSCVNKGYSTAKRFKQSNDQAPVNEMYITLWLHQVHTWFAGDDSQNTSTKVKSFLLDAKKSGFTHLMFDLPWEWTEREGQGDIQIDSWSKKDVMSTACGLDIPLHIVVTMRQFPPWVDDIAAFHEIGSGGSNCRSEYRETTGPSIAHPKVWELVQEYFASVVKLLLDQYGSCIVSVSPTLNNEFETRYTQVRGLMRDYSNASIAAYRDWQVEKSLTSPKEEAFAVPDFPCGEVCVPILDKSIGRWHGFREEFLSNRYIRLCEIGKKTESSIPGKLHHADCLLHIGEFFSSTDALNSNLFFKLAKSEFVDHLVMDSNMVLFGAPSSPSIVGILVSAAQTYGKSVHYEAATERILKCDNEGNFENTQRHVNGGAPLLFQSGIARGLEAGVHSIGVTNLCRPGELGQLLLQSNQHKKKYNVDHEGLLLSRTSSFKPTAVIFVPYRAFYAYSFVISGATCGLKRKACWHESFDKIPTFGHGSIKKSPGMCHVDVAQENLISVWDDLRTRHPQVAVIADPEQLTDDLLQASEERVILHFPCIMTSDKWNFFEGEKLLSLYKAKSRIYPFLEIPVDMSGPCPGTKGFD